MTGRWKTLVFLLVLAAGCSDDETPVSLNPPPSGLQLSVTVSPNRIVAGRSAEVTLQVENYGKDIELDFECMDHFCFRIVKTDGTRTLEYPSCWPEEHRFAIKGGSKKTVKFPIPYNPFHTDLEPGCYKISAGIGEHEDEYPWPTTELVVTYK